MKTKRIDEKIKQLLEEANEIDATKNKLYGDKRGLKVKRKNLTLLTAKLNS